MTKVKYDDDLITADYVIDLCLNHFKLGSKHSICNYSLSTFYLQRLLYFINVAHMLLYGGYKHPLFKDHFRKWFHGAVLEHVYTNYKTFNTSNGSIITRVLPSLNSIDPLAKDPSKISFDPHSQTYLKNHLSDKTRQFIKDILPNFLVFSPITLEDHSLDDAKYQGKIYTSMSDFDIYSNKLTVKFFENPKNQFWRKIKA